MIGQEGPAFGNVNPLEPQRRKAYRVKCTKLGIEPLIYSAVNWVQARERAFRAARKAASLSGKRLPEDMEFKDFKVARCRKCDGWAATWIDHRGLDPKTGDFTNG